MDATSAIDAAFSSLDGLRIYPQKLLDRRGFTQRVSAERGASAQQFADGAKARFEDELTASSVHPQAVVWMGDIFHRACLAAALKQS